MHAFARVVVLRLVGNLVVIFSYFYIVKLSGTAEFAFIIDGRSLEPLMCNE